MSDVAELPRKGREKSAREKAGDAAMPAIQSAGGRAVRLVDAARRAEARGVIHLARDMRTAERVAALARCLADDVEVLVFPPWDCLPYDGVFPSREVMGRRMAVLHALAHTRSSPWLLITTVDAVHQRVPPRSLWDGSATLKLKTGEPLDLEKLDAFLARCGYASDDRVDEPGEAALRGQVADIFPASADHPVRIDHDEGLVTQMRRFDPLTQRTA
jgi:transcription-repair coupling factor (superfamily II helicase)